ncbi:hypothetical protein [Rhodovulum euryhalinum]|uniref:Uncharacterized protein n=1 Tax=Rhodovulum euryhalinum TaxID=35805 RepID=A0A4R2KGM1_9RHOB|nr:hypothetical protein [Rhodovulum euryhalinum]TCO71552.1 hypothetical protein EV655_10644 [Rhodovulum euryhalinum]
MTPTFGTVLDTAKWTFSTRRVARSAIAAMDQDFAHARPGDLVLAQVDRIGQHRRVQLQSGHPSDIFPGDHVVLACGARYAPDQFEGLAEIAADGADLLRAAAASGGWWRATNGSSPRPG